MKSIGAAEQSMQALGSHSPPRAEDPSLVRLKNLKHASVKPSPIVALHDLPTLTRKHNILPLIRIRIFVWYLMLVVASLLLDPRTHHRPLGPSAQSIRTPIPLGLPIGCNDPSIPVNQSPLVNSVHIDSCMINLSAPEFPLRHTGPWGHSGPQLPMHNPGDSSHETSP